MPLYEYQCRKCGHRFERMRKFSDPPVKKCPECGAAVQRLLSPPAVQFKGSGWYVTDYARKGAAHGDSHEPAAGKHEEKAEKHEAKPKGEAKKGHGKK